jgi:hypothetical protein
VATLSLFCRLTIGLLFVVSAVAKLRAPGRFRASVRGYRLVPRGAEIPVATAVLAAELAVPALLLFDRTMVAGLLLAATMLAGFAAAMLTVLRRGLRTSCGCVGDRGAPVRALHVWRNVALLAVTFTGAISAPAVAATAHRPDLVAVAVLAIPAMCVVATAVLLDDLASLFAPPPHEM